jgi:two-component sensor histidine kinase
VSTPGELAAQHTALDGDALAHLQRLLGTWGALADLSLSDLLLMAPTAEGGAEAGKLVVLGQMRPTTTATLLPVDLVGALTPAGDWPVAVEALAEREIRSGVNQMPPIELLVAPPPAPGPGETGEVPAVPGEVRVEAVPVVLGSVAVAAVVRLEPIEHRRRSGRLERVYRGLYDRLAAMVAEGRYPSPGEDVLGEDAPRVGDGLVLMDADGRIVYSSPNAMSALHRMGVTSVPEGHRLGELGVEDAAVDRALSSGLPVIEEVERRPDVIVLVHCTPLVAEGEVTGAMVLMRDVTDLRRLDRLLLSKDAAIREVHHRVKNNLQTISSLLSLQARRLGPGSAQDALREAERRVRSIAVVHEVLSREPGEEVPFDEIVGSLVRMAEDSSIGAHTVSIDVAGDLGAVPADVATPLAVVVAELLQNAVEHAFGEERDAEGRVELQLASADRRLHVVVVDDGCGLPPGFDIDKTASLGLSIVRDLVTSQLGGTITMADRSSEVGSRSPVGGGEGVSGSPDVGTGGAPGAGRGTRVTIEVPLRQR